MGLDRWVFAERWDWNVGNMGNIEDIRNLIDVGTWEYGEMRVDQGNGGMW